jgi:hypothetical protein
VTLTSDAHRLFSERPDLSARFIRAVAYPQGLRAFWRAALLLPQKSRSIPALRHPDDWVMTSRSC